MTLKEIIARRAAIKAEVAARSATLTSEEIDAYEAELSSLDKEEETISKRAALTKRLNAGVVETEVVEEDNPTKERKAEDKSAIATRGKEYKQRNGREISLRAAAGVENTSSESVLIPSHIDPNIEAFPWNEVSSVLDLVTIISLPNGNEYTKVFQTSTGEADYTLEPTKTGDEADKDGVYNLVSTGFDKVTIKRNKITALVYESEELLDLPDLDYATLIERNVSLSMRKKIAKEIILGDGTGNHFVGIAAKDATNLNPNTYKDVPTAIDENTVLDTIIDFGGEEDIEGRQAFVMNKLSLKEFTRVRGSDKKQVYTVTFSGNTALIDGTRVVFTRNLKPYSMAATGEIWAVYGDLSKYFVLNFGGEVIESSREFKFDQGITTVRGKVYGGGNIAGYKAITRLTKPSVV